MGGKFNNYKYRYYNTVKYTNVEIDGVKIRFTELNCGKEIGFLSILLPIPLIPASFSKNTCESDGLLIPFFRPISEEKKDVEYRKMIFQLKYNNKIYNATKEYRNLVKIPNYEEFKKAKDKTLIIHKKRDDGTTITKEIPFEWKLIIDM